MSVAKNRGFLWGRGNLNSGLCATTGTSLYDPRMDPPLATPSYGNAPTFPLERLRRKVEAAKDGKIIILAYHSTDGGDMFMTGEEFLAQMALLREMECNVISMAALGQYIDPAKAEARWTLGT